MRLQRPPSVTILGWFFVCVGCVSLAHGIWRYLGEPPGRQHLGDLVIVGLSACTAAAAGLFTLRGHNWARWVLVVWMGAHVLLSLAHSPVKLVVHGVLFAIVLAVVVSPRASEYFRL